MAPGADSLRPWLHRRRGVRISGPVFIGEDVLIETEYPECVEIHENVSISMRAIIIAHTRGAGKVILEKNCFIGPNAVICCSVGKTLRVGEGAVVSAGSVVTRSVPARTMVAPPPSRAVATLEVPFTNDVAMDQFLSGMKWLGDPRPRR
jgi:acetyltransferase-like isoleucine patch superfamily enzyme